jgi:hypothetical protein
VAVVRLPTGPSPRSRPFHSQFLVELVVHLLHPERVAFLSLTRLGGEAMSWSW